MIFLTNTRKFHCRGCDNEFRAADRRRLPREAPALRGALPGNSLAR